MVRAIMEAHVRECRQLDQCRAVFDSWGILFINATARGLRLCA